MLVPRGGFRSHPLYIDSAEFAGIDTSDAIVPSRTSVGIFLAPGQTEICSSRAKKVWREEGELHRNRL
jgi:hypothetical protein